jgi:RNA polymerase sigma factor
VEHLILVLFKKFLGKLSSDRSAASDERVEDRVAAIQQGDHLLRNQLITDYQPFVAKAVSRFTKRFIDPAHDDEYSVALQAFNEAIDSYDPRNGASFLHFAETVIRRRLIDYARREQRHTVLIPYSSFETLDDEEHVMNPVEISQAILNYDEEQRAEERRSEIVELNQKLLEFGITFRDLVEGSPKHADSRQILMAIGRLLAEDERLMEQLEAKKQLPIKELLDRVSVSRKTLERNRKYLIAVAVIHSGNYPYLSAFLQQEEPQITMSKGVGTHA